MTPLSLRRRILTLTSAAGCGFGLLFCGPQTAFLASAAAQTVDGAPVAAPVPPADSSAERAADPGTVQKNTQDRHLAPHGTFYLLSYVSVTTDTGVEGFVPGQEVHFVEAHRPTHTLVVTDGKAQVEVSPSKLTNDMGIAALVRQQDQADQSRIAAYVQTEEAAYARHEREEDEKAARNDERQKQAAQASQALATTQAQPAGGTQEAQPADASYGGNGYYGLGGYGYGSPYSYFSGGEVVGERNRLREGTGPGGSRGTLPSDNTGNQTRTEPAAGAAAGKGAAQGTAHTGGGKP